MKPRRCFLIFASLALLCPSAYALSLGELNVHSSFGQPLNGDIGIPVYTEAEISDLYVALAPPSVFEEQGLEYLPSVSELRFVIRRDESNAPYISVRTAKPLNELAFGFVIEASWPNGHLVKSFDVLLSPPAMMENAMPAESLLDKTDGVQVLEETVLPPGTEQEMLEALAAEEEQTEQPQELPRRGLPDPQVKQVSDSEWSYGPVRPGESLSSIAEKFETMTSMNIEQRMNVLFRLNPGAFGNHSINQLRAGYILRFRDAPELSEPQSSVEDNRRMPSSTETDTEAELEELLDLRRQLAETREKVTEYRGDNEALKTRLRELEQEVATRAKELGIEPQF